MQTQKTKSHLYWVDSLIKGRIAEVIFEEMMRESGRFTVIPFGYEKKTPEIANKSSTLKRNSAIDVIKKSPDFVLIDNQEHNVFLVEVKFRTNRDNKEILDIANGIYQTWKPAFLFLVTPEEFFFDSVRDVVQNNGEVKPFKHNLIPEELQNEYLKIINNHLA